MPATLLFITMTMTILVTPGPTNTLLATAGATAGPHRAARLILAEALGYCISIAAIGFLVRPLVLRDPSIQTYLREAAVLFLLYMAWHLFRDRTRGVAAKSSVTWSRVFTTTLLNPKAFIFALVVIPFGTPYVGMYLVLFVCILLPISAAWILVGTLLGQAAHRENRKRLARRLCAGVLGIFAVALFVSILPR
jgi:threonine/homoserine/homoserine lactone efflux protein